MNLKSTIAAVAAAALFVLALVLGVPFLLLALVYAVVFVVVFTVPAVRTPFFKLIGITPPSLSDLLSDFEGQVKAFEAHAVAALSSADGHKADAAASTKAAATATANAAHATAVADKIKDVIAPPVPTAAA